MIRTVARRGYVFEAPVTVAIGDPSRARVETGIPPRCESSAPGQHPGNEGRAGSSRVGLTWPVARGAVILGPWCRGGAMRGTRSGTDSERPLRLTDFNDSAVSPSLSNDGRMLAFVRGGSFGTRGSPGGHVYVKLLPSGPPVQLTREASRRTIPLFSPDDSRIVYTTSFPPLKWDSWQVPVLGGHRRRFCRMHPRSPGSTTGDSCTRRSWRAFTWGWRPPRRAAPSIGMSIFPSREDGMAHRSASSPDGKSLLVVEMNGGTFLPCRLVPADGSSPGRTVSPPGGQCTSAAWSPMAGGCTSLPMRAARSTSGVSAIPMAPEQITFGPTEQEGTAITKDGKYLITSMGLQRSSIWLREGDRNADSPMKASPRSRGWRRPARACITSRGPRRRGARRAASCGRST